MKLQYLGESGVIRSERAARAVAVALRVVAFGAKEIPNITFRPPHAGTSAETASQHVGTPGQRLEGLCVRFAKIFGTRVLEGLSVDGARASDTLPSRDRRRSRELLPLAAGGGYHPQRIRTLAQSAVCQTEYPQSKVIIWSSVFGAGRLTPTTYASHYDYGGPAAATAAAAQPWRCG